MHCRLELTEVTIPVSVFHVNCSLAFILYRQHHQAQVAAQNPTLSNPDISRIIGDKWKDEPENVKSEWKALAEAEKQRHQQQYPDYRYQPRRGGKGQSGRPGSSPGEDGGRCPKCNGRSIATPRTPATPFSTPTAATPGLPPYTPTLRDGVDYARRGSYGNVIHNRVRYVPQHSNREFEDYDPESPDMKRRRFNNAGSYHAVPQGNMTHEMYLGRQLGPSGRTMSLGAPSPGLRPYSASMSDQGPLTRSKSGPMPPPPRPSMSGQWPEHGHPSGRHAAFDESLRLPPLQTSVPMSPSTAAEVDVRQLSTPIHGLGIAASRDPQARSIEAMVMSIPFTRKLTVLARVSPPLAPPSPGSPGYDTRGAVIAVEGPNSKMLQTVADFIEKTLTTCNEVSLKMWANPSNKERRSSDASDSEREKTPSETLGCFTAYFQAMSEWHQNSKEIVHHITTRAPEPSQSPEANNMEEDKSSRRGSADSSISEPHTKATSSKTPVALLKEGFSLSSADKFACMAPISDSYAPVDHWQWMATMWRGVVGADLVVYVKPSVEEEIAKFGAVNVQKQPGLIVVRIPVGKEFDEATERRVAFEIIEWLRGGSFREGFTKA